MHIPVPALVVFSLVVASLAVSAEDHSDDEPKGWLSAAEDVNDHPILRHELDCMSGTACPIVMFSWDTDDSSREAATDARVDRIR